MCLLSTYDVPIYHHSTLISSSASANPSRASAKKADSFISSQSLFFLYQSVEIPKFSSHNIFTKIPCNQTLSHTPQIWIQKTYYKWVSRKKYSSESEFSVFPHCGVYHIVVKYIDTSKQCLLTWGYVLYSVVFLSDTVLHNKSTSTVIRKIRNF